MLLTYTLGALSSGNNSSSYLIYNFPSFCMKELLLWYVADICFFLLSHRLVFLFSSVYFLNSCISLSPSILICQYPRSNRQFVRVLRTTKIFSLSLPGIHVFSTMNLGLIFFTAGILSFKQGSVLDYHVKSFSWSTQMYTSFPRYVICFCLLSLNTSNIEDTKYLHFFPIYILA